jgi:gluconate 2-dehydrogenase gamma chain
MTSETERKFFSEHEWNTIEAATSRIIPTDRDPGAREAGVTRFIDHYLSGIDYIYANPWGSGFVRLEGDRAKAWKIRIDRQQKRYREGVEQLDRASKERFAKLFVALEEIQQDEVLAAMSPSGRKPEPVVLDTKMKGPDGDRRSGPKSSARIVLSMPVTDDDLDFFGTLILHTRMGFYSDPAYKGNKDHVGWRVIGFPGPKALVETLDGRFSTAQYLTPADHKPCR